MERDNGWPVRLHRVVRAGRGLLAVTLLVSTGVFVVWSWHWPLVGDASLIHYICFMMDHGFRPYRDLGDMNMPGSFLIEWTAMHVLGGGDRAWHAFDLLLLSAAGAAMFLIAWRPGEGGWRRGWFPGLLSSCLLALVHGRDGMGQTGQRDLTMAVALLLATACLFQAVRRGGSRGAVAAAGLAGLFAGVASTIKPTALPFGVVLFALAALAMRRRGVSPVSVGLAAILGYCVAPAVALGFLLREGVLTAFVGSLWTVVPFYASLGHRPLSFLLSHSISPLMPVVLLWVAMLAARAVRSGRGPARKGATGGEREDAADAWFGSWERLALGCGVAFGLLSYVVQARGFPYYRYPLLVFLLPLMALDLDVDLDEALRAATGVGGSSERRTWAMATGWMAAVGLLVAGLVVAPTSAVLISRYDPANIDFISSLQADLNGLGGPLLSGHIQCIDSIAGCGTTLYRMRLVQTTGVLSDFLLFGPTMLPPGRSADSIPIVHSTRAALMSALIERGPRVLVISSYLHIDGPDNYEKLRRWPEFEAVLESRYNLQTEWRPTRPSHWWSRRQWPNGYRVYVLKGASGRG